MKPAVYEDQRSAPTRGIDAAPLVLRLRPVIELSGDQLLELSNLNDDLRLELTAEGELIVMAPAGGESSRRNFELATQLGFWTKREGGSEAAGVAFDSSGGFVLPNGAIRSPDVSWVERSRYDALSPDQRERYLPLCPDFVVELRSPSDSLGVLQGKMVEYMENGAWLGLLLDPARKRVHVYEPGKPARELADPEEVPADPVLPGFVLKPREVW